jgi:cytochrome c
LAALTCRFTTYTCRNQCRLPANPARDRKITGHHGPFRAALRQRDALQHQAKVAMTWRVKPLEDRMKFALYLAAGLMVMTGVAHADGDASAGAKVFKKCMACHTATAAKNKVGPSLMGVVGRKVATEPGYKYSEAMVAFGAGGKVWDEATLTTYLAGPKAIVPKTKMTFPGLKTPQEIADVIAYLKNPAAAN